MLSGVATLQSSINTAERHYAQRRRVPATFWPVRPPWAAPVHWLAVHRGFLDRLIVRSNQYILSHRWGWIAPALVRPRCCFAVCTARRLGRRRGPHR